METKLAKKSSKKISEKKVEAPILQAALPAELVVSPEEQKAITALCDEIGATREHCIRTLYEGSLATKITLDKYGEEHVEPNTAERTKNALALLEIRGDFKNKDAVKPTTYNTVIYQWKR